MPGYMPDHVFERSVVSAVKDHLARGGQLDRQIKRAFTTYFRNYDDDDYVAQGMHAALRILTVLKSEMGSKKELAHELDEIALRAELVRSNSGGWNVFRTKRTQPNYKRSETLLAKLVRF